MNQTTSNSSSLQPINDAWEKLLAETSEDNTSTDNTNPRNIKSIFSYDNIPNNNTNSNI